MSSFRILLKIYREFIVEERIFNSVIHVLHLPTDKPKSGMRP